MTENVIQRVCVFAEPLNDATEWSGVEEGHARVHDRFEQFEMQSGRGGECGDNPGEGSRPGDERRDDAYCAVSAEIRRLTQVPLLLRPIREPDVRENAESALGDGDKGG